MKIEYCGTPRNQNIYQFAKYCKNNYCFLILAKGDIDFKRCNKTLVYEELCNCYFCIS